MRQGCYVVLLLAAPLFADVHLSGRVTNENNSPILAAQITLASPAGLPVTVRSDAAGNFAVALSAPGEYRITAEHEGFFRLSGRAVELTEGENELHLVLNSVREQFDSVDVVAAGSRMDFDRTASEQSLGGTDILAVPYPSTHELRNALPLLPGVLQDSLGGLHFNGGAEEQTLYTVDGFTVNDPLSGRFETRLSVEAVKTIDSSGGRFSAEYGKGSAGTLAITTTPGDDKIRYNATNFVPGVESHKGLLLGDWTPRLNLSGPIRKGRAWFSDSVGVQYNQTVIEELPVGADRASRWRASNLLHTQVNLTPAQILHVGFLFNGWWAPAAGLGVLSPYETTVNQRSRQWFFYAKDQIYFGRGAMAELGYAANRTFARDIPQGHNPLVLTPEAKRGNYNIDDRRGAGRDQVLANFFLPSFTWHGTHQTKTGTDVDRLTYWQEVRRSPLEQVREDGSLIRRVEYSGPGALGRSNVEFSGYLQDTWRPRTDLLIESGIRLDWDRMLGNWNPAARFGFAWSPRRLPKTKISAGYAMIYESTSLRLFTRPLDQCALATYYTPSGAVSRGPAASVFVFSDSHLATPHSYNWSAGFEEELPRSVYLRLNYLRRRGHHGFTYANAQAAGATPDASFVARFPTTAFDAIYRMGNGRRDEYDSLEVTLRQTVRKQYEWLASYTRSRAYSNAVADVAVDDPIIVSSNVGPMPWDAPNRFIGWGRLPLPRLKWAAAFLCEWRTGFPFSVTSSEGVTVGAFNSLRYADYFALNLHGERRFVFRKQQWEFRGGFNNISNRRNPNEVVNNQDSPNFLHFYGGGHRTLNFRIRWLGPAARQ